MATGIAPSTIGRGLKELASDERQEPAGERVPRPLPGLGVTNSTCERWRPLGFLAVEPRCERLTVLIVRKLNGNVDCISVLITNEPGRLNTDGDRAIRASPPSVSKIRGAHPNFEIDGLDAAESALH
jgi:hypothetical protein